jgi:diguanylate cyclase (GGDEF)-like protein/PAS domain S-box-containing protein
VVLFANSTVHSSQPPWLVPNSSSERVPVLVTDSIPAFYWLPPLISGVSTLGLAILLWIRRPSLPAVVLGFYLFSIALWSFGYLMELRGVTVEQKLFWSKFEYLGHAFMPLMGLIFVLQYTGYTVAGRKGFLLMLGAIPVLTQALVWTNGMHGWIWRRFWLDHAGPYPMTGRTHGPWFWVLLSYGYLLSICSIILLFNVLFRRRGIYRWQAAVMLIGCMIPFAGNAMYAFGFGPLHQLDLTVFAFSITGISMTWGLFGLSLPRIIPVARDTVIEGMSDGVVVLDSAGSVVEVNPETCAIFGVKGAEIVGRPVSKAFSAHPEFLDVCRHTRAARVEISVTGESARRFDVKCSVLTSRFGRAVGSLIVLRDITEREAAGAKLREAHAELERRVAHRTEDLSRTIEELRDVQYQLSYSATHDSLTGLANRKMFLERLSDRLQRATKENHPRFAVLFLDVDRFKLYNDGYGHATGDLILIEIGHRLQRLFRESDTVARMGGDEFTILIEHLDQINDTARIGERSRKYCPRPSTSKVVILC